MRSKMSLTIVFTAFVVLWLSANAGAYTIDDQYYGGDPWVASQGVTDSIGGLEYNIEKMEVSISGTSLVVDVYSPRFFDHNIGVDGIVLGDLFISTTGWNPFVGDPVLFPKYGEDIFSNGEEWEYVLSFDSLIDRNPTNSLGEVIIESGSLSLYEIDTTRYPNNSDPSIMFKEDFDPSNGDLYVDWKDGQEVAYNGVPENSLATGYWRFYNLYDDDATNDFLRFEVDYRFDFTGDLGLRWQMTCANDIIEGSAPVPEPATMFLFGAGLVTLAGLGHRRKK